MEIYEVLKHNEVLLLEKDDIGITYVVNINGIVSLHKALFTKKEVEK